MKSKNLNKSISILLTLFLILGTYPLVSGMDYASQECSHTHDGTCGYAEPNDCDFVPFTNCGHVCGTTVFYNCTHVCGDEDYECSHTCTGDIEYICTYDCHCEPTHCTHENCSFNAGSPCNYICECSTQLSEPNDPDCDICPPPECECAPCEDDCDCALCDLFGAMGIMAMSTGIDINAFADTDIASGTGWNFAGGVLTITAGGTYIINGNSTLTSNRIVVNIDSPVNIILKNVIITAPNVSQASPLRLNDGADVTLTLEGINTLRGTRVGAGIAIGNSEQGNASLTINGSGTLNAHGNGDRPGIGEFNGDGNTIIIESGIVNAYGGTGSHSGAAGIGGGGHLNGSGGTIIINGGTVTAIGGMAAAGIGGGLGGHGGVITITGGVVVAKGGGSDNDAGAGIGGGEWGNGGTITIRGGTITAVGGTAANGTNGGAGIGGGTGNPGNDSTVRITNGTITAIGGGTNAPGIGGGYRPPFPNNHGALVMDAPGGTVSVNRAGAVPNPNPPTHGTLTTLGNRQPEITHQPANQTSIEGQNATFTAIVIGAPAPRFQWEVSTNGGSTWSNVASGGTSATLTLSNTTTAMRGYQYRVVATNSEGSAISNAATLMVTPLLTGTPTITGDFKFGQTLTVNTSTLNATTGFKYQWQRGSGTTWTNIGTNSATYQLTQADIGHQIRVAVSAANFGGSQRSNATPVVIKASGPAAPGAPTVSGTPTSTSITLNTITGAEYRRGTTGVWQDSPTFSGLNPNTGYTFYARIKETATHFASAISPASATITTQKASGGGGTGGGGNNNQNNQDNQNQTPTTPTTQPSTQPTQTTPTTTPDPTPSIPVDMIKEAINNSDSPRITLSPNDPTVIGTDALQLIRESGKPLDIVLPNGIVVTIDPNSITDNARSIDIMLHIVLEAKTVNNMNVPDNSIAITLSDHGEFGFALTFNVSAEQLAKAGIDINNVRLFHISLDSVITEKPDYFVVNDDGSITITISHASGYVLTEEDMNLLMPVDSETEPKVTEYAVINEIPATKDIPATPVIEAVVPESSNNTWLWILIITGIAGVTACTVVLILRRRGTMFN